MELDTRRIAKLEQETAQVAELLASVFREEDNAQALAEVDETRARESSSYEVFSGRSEVRGTDKKEVTVIALVPEGPVMATSTAVSANRALDAEQQSRLASVFAILDDYVHRPFDETLTKYLVDDLMHADQVIAWSYLSRRVLLDPAFRQHPFGLSAALRDTVTTLQLQGVLVALDTAAVGERYGSTGEAFAVRGKPTSAEVMPEATAPDSHKGAGNCAPLFPTLDSKHSQLLDCLLTRPEWSRQELLQLANELGLMLDGALERINEAALDSAGTMVLDGENPVLVDQTFLENFNS